MDFPFSWLSRIKIGGVLRHPLFQPYIPPLPQASQLGLVMTQLLGTILAGEALIGLVRETFRMSVHGHFPLHQYNQSYQKQAPGEKPLGKYQRCKHHGKIPIVNPAGSTTTVLHEPALERAEEQDTNHITNRVRQTNQE